MDFGKDPTHRHRSPGGTVCPTQREISCGTLTTGGTEAKEECKVFHRGSFLVKYKCYFRFFVGRRKIDTLVSSVVAVASVLHQAEACRLSTSIISTVVSCS